MFYSVLGFDNAFDAVWTYFWMHLKLKVTSENADVVGGTKKRY